MYDYIKGLVADKGAAHVVIEAAGVGYYINTSTSTINRLSGEGKVYTYLVVREDEMSLYGFYTKEERQMFTRLIGVNGVGPKMALAIMSAMNMNDLSLAIITGDDKAFKRVSGVGPKTAQRIILELRERIETPQGETFVADTSGESDAAAEAVAALIALGYDRSTAAKAVTSVRALGDTPNELILMALKRIGGN